MIKLQTIETEKYEVLPDKIHVKRVGMITGEEAVQLLQAHLSKMGMLPDEYFLPSSDPEMKLELPDFRSAICHTDWGGSEGIYLDISLLYYENREVKHFHLATGKTLDESGEAYLRMSRIAAECSMMLNGRGSIVKLPDNAYENFKPLQEEKSSLDSIIQSAAARTAESKSSAEEKSMGQETTL